MKKINSGGAAGEKAAISPENEDACRNKITHTWPRSLSTKIPDPVC